MAGRAAAVVLKSGPDHPFPFSLPGGIGDREQFRSRDDRFKTRGIAFGDYALFAWDDQLWKK